MRVGNEFSGELMMRTRASKIHHRHCCVLTTHDPRCENESVVYSKILILTSFPQVQRCFLYGVQHPTSLFDAVGPGPGPY